MEIGRSEEIPVLKRFLQNTESKIDKKTSKTSHKESDEELYTYTVYTTLSYYY